MKLESPNSKHTHTVLLFKNINFFTPERTFYYFPYLGYQGSHNRDRHLYLGHIRKIQNFLRKKNALLLFFYSYR